MANKLGFFVVAATVFVTASRILKSGSILTNTTIIHNSKNNNTTTESTKGSIDHNSFKNDFTTSSSKPSDPTLLIIGKSIFSTKLFRLYGQFSYVQVLISLHGTFFFIIFNLFIYKLIII
jgi:hypothetical protein